MFADHYTVVPVSALFEAVSFADLSTRSLPPQCDLALCKIHWFLTEFGPLNRL